MRCVAKRELALELQSTRVGEMFTKSDVNCIQSPCVTFLPRYASAVSFIFVNTIAEISSGVNVLESDPTWT